jgi:hypothetical protein
MIIDIYAKIRVNKLKIETYSCGRRSQCAAQWLTGSLIYLRNPDRLTHGFLRDA